MVNKSTEMKSIVVDMTCSIDRKDRQLSPEERWQLTGKKEKKEISVSLWISEKKKKIKKIRKILSRDKVILVSRFVKPEIQ